MRISRIYVDRFGTPTSWYEEISLDLCDPLTGEPIDTCMNLENAGGKTSLLSYIFSCFEPKQERWLQHLQSKAHGFKDYFARDVRPSFIALEWIMPSRSPNGQPYRLIIGQIVQLKEAADRASEVDRRFFAFEANTDLAWEHLPVPGISIAPVQTMQDFLNWGHHKARLDSQGDFFITHNQGEWVTHLEQRRLIDVELLSMQLSFNSREGGSEEGFLSFSSESDLISKLLNLSMNQEHTVALRDMVAQTMDRLKSKPKYEARLIQLELLQQAMEPFAGNAAKLLGAKAALLAVEQEAADTAFTMRDQINSLDVRLASASSVVAQLEQLATNADDEAATAQRRHLALQHLKLSRDDIVAKSKTSELQLKHKTGLVRFECLKGAWVKREIANVGKLIEELEKQIAALKEELKPFEAEAAQNGAMLRLVLQQQIGKQQQARHALSAQESELKTALARIAQQREQGSTRMTERSLTKGSVEERIRGATQIQDSLIENGLLLPTDFDVSAAIDRLRSLIAELHVKLNELRDQRSVKRGSLSEAQGKVSQTQQNIINAQHAQNVLKQRLSEYDRYVEGLQNDPILSSVVEGQCDPHSASLVSLLQQYIEATKSELSNCAISLKQLHEQQQSIEQTGLGGRSDDVDLVVRSLISAGVRSAKAANTYVADLRPDAVEARALVLSDPARFLGVNVAREEWSKAHKAAQSLQLKLSLPVTLAVASLDAEPISDDRYVFGPEKDSVFNKVAAAQLLADCEVFIEQTHTEYDAYSRREKEAQSALANLQRFQREYTRDAIQQTALEFDQRQDEIEAGNATLKELHELTHRLSQEVEGLSGQIETLPAEISGQGNGLKRLEDYAENWEPKIDSGRRELAEIDRELTQIAQLLQQLKAEEGLQERRLEDTRRELVDIDAKVGELQREFDLIERYDSDFDADARIREQGYDVNLLRTLYSNALSLLNSQEENKLGIVGYQLREQGKRALQLADQYRKEYGRQDEADVMAIAESDVDIEMELDAQKKRNAQIDTDKEHAVHESGVASALLDSFVREHTPEQPTHDMHSLQETEVLTAIELELNTAQAKTAEAERLRRQIGQKRVECTADEKRKDALAIQANLMSSAFPVTNSEPKLIQLDGDIEGRVRSILGTRTSRDKAVQDCHSETSKAHRELVKVACHAEFVAAEPEVSLHISQDDFDRACTDHNRLVGMIHDRIASVTDQLNEMTPDFESCVNEVYNQSTSASSLVKYASEIRMPIGTPYVSGKVILQMGGNLSGKSSEQRKTEIRHYLNSQIEGGVVPSTGADIITQCLLRFTSDKSFGLQMLKMEQNTDFQYQPVNAMKKSGGQGTVIATFLYMLVSHMRVNTQAQAKRGGGGPLILDNPFANVQTRALIDAQRKLATSLGIQLICFTANADANILEGFRRIIRLRKAGVNSKTKRTHIEMAKATFAEMAS